MTGVIVQESPIEGMGVFAGREFAPGETVMVIDTSRVVDEDHPLRPDLDEREHHCAFFGDGRAVLLPSPERHLNHCCDPSAYLRTVRGRVQVVARRAIQAGDEVTLDYVINTHGGTRWSCRCVAWRRGGVRVHTMGREQDVQLVYDSAARQHAGVVSVLSDRSVAWKRGLPKTRGPRSRV